MSIIYVDNSATTKLRDEVFEDMLPFIQENYGNPSSIYKIGRDNKNIIENSRSLVAKCFGAKNNEIFFTSGGTESNNLAILGVIEGNANKIKKNHIITTNIEHYSVLNTFKNLESKGYEVTYLKVNKSGLISIDDLINFIKEETFLISIMFVNNEIGTIMPIKKIGEIAKDKNIIFHTDAVQACKHLHIDVNELNIDLMSISAHKFNGPKGVGALFIRENIPFKSVNYGGHQETNLRSGTENIVGIVGLTKALSLSIDEMELQNKKIENLKNKFISSILNEIPMTFLNGCSQNRIVNNINIFFKNVPADVFLLRLDMEGVCASGGSACTSGSIEPSHVLIAIGLKEEEALSSIRFSLGYFNTEDEIQKGTYSSYEEASNYEKLLRYKNLLVSAS